jgi:serine/threonine protein kinase
MPVPSTSEEFIELIRKSGVLEEHYLDGYIKRLRSAGALPAEPTKLASLMFRDGILTHFQAENFLQGRWRRFTIGKYKVLERIATGGMASVYLCEHKFMRRRAAVKVLPATRASDPASLERFYREARAVAALDHPNIVRAYDVDQDDQLNFLVMEYVDGSSLQEIVKKSGPLDPVRAAHYISQAALGLQHAFEVASLVHRDIKPGNLIVDRNGTVKVLDMGLARFFNDEDDLLTRQHDESVLGTADYLAPEQVLDSHDVDIRADIYGLGATFYYCMTGKTPFGEGTIAQKLIWHQTRQPKPIRSIRKEVPEELAAIVDKMMAKERDQRYPTPIEVVEALAKWTQGSIGPPAESEMPALSLAARGGARSDSNSGPRPSPRAKPASPPPRPEWQGPESPGPGTPTDSPSKETSLVSPGSSPTLPVDRPAESPPPVAPLITAGDEFRFTVKVAPTINEEDDSLPWQNLTAAIKDVKATADKSPSAPIKRKAIETPPKRPLSLRPQTLWIGGVAIGILTLTAMIWGLIAANSSTPPKKTASASEGSRLVVSRSSLDGVFPNLRQALKKAKPKDHIVLADSVVEEQADLQNKKDITIEAEEGKTVVWRYPEKQRPGKFLLSLDHLERVRLKGFTLDGAGKVDHTAVLSGNCPGLTLENISFRGFNESAILMVNCAGTIGSPVSLLQLESSTALPCEAALSFQINPRFADPKTNQYIVVRDCRFNGPYKSAIQRSDPAALKESVFDGNAIQPSANGPVIEIQGPK